MNYFGFERRGGVGFLQLGNWRIGMFDIHHFTFSHRSGYTAVVYNSDGTYQNGNGKLIDYGLWERKGGQNQQDKVIVEQNKIQFGDVWTLANIDNQHLSLSHMSGKTCMIWRKDGTCHYGPRMDFGSSCVIQQNMSNSLIHSRYIQIGQWRIGQYDIFHLSICSLESTCQIYRADGTIHHGPRTDFNLWKK